MIQKNLSKIDENEQESSLEKLVLPDMKKETSLITLGNQNWKTVVPTTNVDCA